MKFRLALLVISSCTLFYLVACHEDVIRIPETSSNVDVKSIVPECFMDSVDAHVKQKGYQTIKGKQINPNKNPWIFELIVSKILDETLELLDKFTVLIVAMVERNKTMSSLEFVLDYIELHVSKMTRGLEFLFDNKAELTDVLTGYIFYKGFKCIFITYYGENYTYSNIVEMFVGIKKQQWLKYLHRVPTEETYQELYTEVEQSLEDISKAYQQLIVKSSEWLSPKCLKWSNLLESNSKIAGLFKEVIVVDNDYIYNQYLQIKCEFNSVKVMDFYVKVGKSLDNIVLQTAIDMMNSLLKLILQLITDGSNKDNSFAQLNRANQFVDNFLQSVICFKNWMSHSKRLLSSKQMLRSPTINVLQDNVSYCKKYNSENFPSTVAPFLEKFKTSVLEHFPDIELNLTKITNKLIHDSITQIGIIDNMERNVKLMVMLLEETSSGRCS